MIWKLEIGIGEGIFFFLSRYFTYLDKVSMSGLD